MVDTHRRGDEMMEGYTMNFGGLYMLSTWVLVGFSTYALYKIYIHPGNGKTKSDSALDILKKRYAKGEINSEEYRKIKNDLIEG